MTKAADAAPLGIRVTTYADLEKIVQAFAGGALNLLILLGSHGLGKSRIVRHALPGPVCWLDGNTSVFGLYCQLWHHRHQPVVLDDLDGLYASRDGIRLLKCLTQSEPVKRVSWHTDAPTLLRDEIPHAFIADKVEGIASSPPGGYRAAAERVNGPIVVTFSTKDLSVGLVYPRASRIAKQIGECAEKAGNLVALDLYQGLGGVGVRGQKSVAMLPVGGEYHFQKGLNCIDATNFIVPIGDNPDAHSQIYTPEVAWLLWAAVLRR